jgi:hypothetical protein
MGGESTLNHKTVFLVDRSTSFMLQSCEQPIEFDVFTKNRQTPAGIIPLAAICKSLWTCTVESIMEYARVSWDLFPELDHLLAMAVFHNSGANVLTEWIDDHQNLTYLSTALAKCALIEPPSPSTVSTRAENFAPNAIQHVLRLLRECSPMQSQRLRQKCEVSNGGRVIVVSQFANNTQVTNFVKQFNEQLLAQAEQSTGNSLSDPEPCPTSPPTSSSHSSQHTTLPVEQCELVVLNTFPVVGKVPKITEINEQSVSPILRCSVQNVRSGQQIATRMIKLVLEHYGLSSTTVTGIPMKEEQNASSSANYDVEIVHANEVHADVLQTRADHPDGSHSACLSMKEEAQYETVSLKWCTPKSSQIDLQHCSSAHRFTAVDVNSRPSSCLINFLLSGRTVMLEMPKLKGKCMSHMLAAHAGELYIHTLNHSRSVLEELPSITEGVGGRITDYRITDFGELIRKAKLVRCKMPENVTSNSTTAGMTVDGVAVGGSSVGSNATGRNHMDLPLDRAKQFLHKQTLYWPLTLGHTLMFNLTTQLQPLFTLMPKEQLTLEEVNECKAAIYQVVSMESKNQPLPALSVACRGRHAKREESYKLLWKELEQFVELHACTTEHNQVLHCIRELHNKSDKKGGDLTSNGSVATPLTSASRKFAIVDEAEVAWKELEKFNNLSEREKAEVATAEPAEKKAKYVSLTSASALVANASKSSARSTFTIGGPISLFGLYAKKLDQESSKKRLEFKGRMNGLSVAPLYTTINELKPENPL